MTWMHFVAEQWPLVTALAVLIVAFFAVESKKGGKTITHHEMTRLLNQDAAYVVDLRDSSDYKQGHIVNALNLPFAQLKDRQTELDKHKDKTLILVDKMGQHTGAAGKQLRDAGFTTLRLQGGMAEWLAQNLPVIKPGKSKKSDAK
jgi:rhodanese-related sulfurtransferase